MGFFDEFEVIDLEEEIEDSYLTITRKSLRFNRATARILDNPSTVSFFFNREQKKLGIAPKREADKRGVDFTLKEGPRNPPIYIKDLHVLKKLEPFVKFEKDGKELSHTVKGQFLSDDNAIVFDLTKTMEGVVNPRGKKKDKKDSTKKDSTKKDSAD